MSGTSMACPHVSGVAALLLSEQPDMTPEQVKDTLVSKGEGEGEGEGEGNWPWAVTRVKSSVCAYVTARAFTQHTSPSLPSSPYPPNVQVCYSATDKLDSWEGDYRSDDVPRYLLQSPSAG